MHIFSIPNFGLNVAELTENVDKSIRHQVPKFVGGVTLVDGAWPWLHVAENNSVAIHLPPVVFRCVCFKMTMAATLFRRKGCVGVWKEGTPILLTFYGNAVDKPGNHRFRLTTDSASQDACLIRCKDQVPRSADPEWSRCERMTGVISTLLWFPFQTSCKWCGQCSELSSTTLHHNGCVPFTVTLMMWCTVPSRFVAVQRYSPASVSTTSEILSVFWKVWKDTLLLGSSPPSFCQEISGVGLSLTEIQTSIDFKAISAVFLLFQMLSADLQALSDALQLQSFSSEDHFGAGGSHRIHEPGLMIPLWVLWRHKDKMTSQTVSFSCRRPKDLKHIIRA